MEGAGPDRREVATAQPPALRFGEPVRDRAIDASDAWLADADCSALRAFAVGLKQDEAAMQAALTQGWNNGRGEPFFDACSHPERRSDETSSKTAAAILARQCRYGLRTASR